MHLIRVEFISSRTIQNHAVLRVFHLLAEEFYHFHIALVMHGLNQSDTLIIEGNQGISLLVIRRFLLLVRDVNLIKLLLEFGVKTRTVLHQGTHVYFYLVAAL